MKALILFLIFFSILPPVVSQENSLPKGFVYLDDIIPDIIMEVRYAVENNFLGAPVTGYKTEKIILSAPAAKALKKVQQELKTQGFCLKVFDGYRPQRAVNHFISWAKKSGDTLTKQQFYPEVDKKDLFKLGYISTRSGHSRGSTVDLTIINADTEEEVDMGGPYDFFGELSHHSYDKISIVQKNNRQLLKKAMMKYGFQPYAKEWWHYTYQPEPYPDTYFDFVVE